MRPENPRSVYLDSTALLTVIKGEPGFEVITEVLHLAESGKLRVWICSLTFVEVRGGGLNAPVDPVRDRQVVELLRSPYMTSVEVHDGVALRARGYAHRLRLKNYDAVHLACAVEAGVEVLMTSDKRFPHGQVVDGVWIDEPYIPGDQPIPGI